MVTFASAGLLVFFDGTTVRTRVTMAIISVLCALAVGWCIRTIFDHQHSWLERFEAVLTYRLRRKQRQSPDT
jgi:hypothetical protein